MCPGAFRKHIQKQHQKTNKERKEPNKMKKDETSPEADIKINVSPLPKPTKPSKTYKSPVFVAIVTSSIILLVVVLCVTFFLFNKRRK